MQVLLMRKLGVLLALLGAPIVMVGQQGVSSGSGQNTNAVPAGAGTPAANLPVFDVAKYGASGSAGTGACSGVAGTNTLTSCVANTYDFAVGQGIRIVGGGVPTTTRALTSPPTVTRYGTGSGSHSFCYVVDTVDPLQGISAPSPRACVSNEPDLSYQVTWNALSVPSPANIGPSPAFLWYVSEDGGPFQLVNVGGFSSTVMDVGQRSGTRGGWPNNLPAGNPDISKNEDFFTYITGSQGNQVTTGDPLIQSFVNATIVHDDTRAVQNAVNAAVAAGGGTVQFDRGIYMIQRPSFLVRGTLLNPMFSTDLSLDYGFEGFNYIDIPSNSAGKIHIQGLGANTVVVTPPDYGGGVAFLEVGFETRPNELPGVIKMEDVAKGATSLVLTGDTGGLSAGDDIWLYSGSFGQTPCLDTNGTSGECHFSELNTVASISGNTVTLVYPTSKRYFDDGGSSFGLVRMPKTPTVPHDIALQNLTFDTYNQILATGIVYDLLIDSVTINGFVNHGPFGGGFKRDVTIQNSTWGFGIGDLSFGGTDEYDQFTNVAFLHNTVVGYAAPGSEEYSEMARIHATEGSSQFTFRDNTFYDVSLYLDQTTDDVISHNQFTNGIINIGTAFGGTDFLFGPEHDASFDSFGSQASADIDYNTFNSDSAYVPPFLLQIGHFTNATITGNTISYQGNEPMAAINAYSGDFSGNTINLSGELESIAITLVPDESPKTTPAPFRLENNTFNISGFSLGALVPDPGFNDPASICIQNNVFNQYVGLGSFVLNPGSVNLSCAD